MFDWLPFWPRKPREWMITSQDLHYNGYEASATLQDGWQPIGVTYVPNVLGPPQLRLWLRRPHNFKKTKPQVIKIQSAGWGGHEVILHLSQFWVPIGVDTSPGSTDQAIIWFVKEDE